MNRFEHLMVTKTVFCVLKHWISSQSRGQDDKSNQERHSSIRQSDPDPVISSGRNVAYYSVDHFSAAYCTSYIYFEAANIDD